MVTPSYVYNPPRQTDFESQLMPESRQVLCPMLYIITRIRLVSLSVGTCHLDFLLDAP